MPSHTAREAEMLPQSSIKSRTSCVNTRARAQAPETAQDARSNPRVLTGAQIAKAPSAALGAL